MVRARVIDRRRIYEFQEFSSIQQGWGREKERERERESRYLYVPADLAATELDLYDSACFCCLAPG